jgi:hypothetical protein
MNCGLQGTGYRGQRATADGVVPGRGRSRRAHSHPRRLKTASAKAQSPPARTPIGRGAPSPTRAPRRPASAARRAWPTRAVEAPRSLGGLPPLLRRRGDFSRSAGCARPPDPAIEIAAPKTRCPPARTARATGGDVPRRPASAARRARPTRAVEAMFAERVSARQGLWQSQPRVYPLRADAGGAHRNRGTGRTQGSCRLFPVTCPL